MAGTSETRYLPVEIMLKIWGQALPIPGIHFFGMDRKRNLKPGEEAIVSWAGNRALLPPRPRPEGDNYWWFPSENENDQVDPHRPPNPRATFFGGGNPSAYATHANLLELCPNSEYVVDNYVSKNTAPEDWERLGPSTAGAPRPTEEEVVNGPSRTEGKIRINKTTDIVCFQIPNRTSHREWLGNREVWYNLAYIGKAFPALASMEAVAFELRPKMKRVDTESKAAWWVEDWKALGGETAPEPISVYGTLEDELNMEPDADIDPHRFDNSPDQVHIGTHFKNLKTIYLLDYAIRLRTNKKPSKEAKRWRGGSHDFVEVLEGDKDVWKRDEDGAPGVVHRYNAKTALAKIKAEHVLCEKLWEGMQVKMMARVSWL